MDSDAEVPARSGQSLTELAKKAISFRDERDWAQFHTPANLAAALSVEASELLELFLWQNSDAATASGVAGSSRERIQDEIGDVLILLLLMAESVGVDAESAMLQKLEKNAQKYPVGKSRGRAVKYTEL